VSRPRILLVDDQKMILLGLERMLRRMRNAWDVVLAGSGREAQGCMEDQAFDVLLSDLNMPGFGGAELLEWSRERHPGTIRIVLSGHQNKPMILASTRTAHRFLTKPCEPDVLVATLSETLEACLLPAGRGGVRQAVVGMGSLPVGPGAARGVAEQLQDPSGTVPCLQDHFLEDAGLASMVLHFVNSAFFGVPRPILNPWEAFQLLDRDSWPAIRVDPVPSELESRLQPLREKHLAQARHALAITRSEGAPVEVQNLAYIGGLLAVAGPMILAISFPERFEEAMAQPQALGVDLQQLAYHYFRLRGLPAPLLEIVGNPREPGRYRQPPSLALAAVHVASGKPDESFLSGTPFLGRVPTWQRLHVPAQG